MANISKPTDINKIWSASGDVLAPSDTKISQGWSVEIPPRQYFNYIDNKQDQAIAHINQHGIAVWDAVTEYQANTSYTQGSNGVVYKCLITNTNINPVGDTTNSWRVAFLDSTAATGPTVATAAQSRSWTDNTVFISPLQLANAFTGAANQSLSVNGFQKLPGGLILQWGVSSATTSVTTVIFPVTFPNAVLYANVHDRVNLGSNQITLFNISNLVVSGFQAVNIGILTQNSPSLSAPGSNSCPWFAVGY